MGFSAAGPGLTGNVDLDSSASQTADYKYEATVDGSVVYFKSALTAEFGKLGLLTGSAGSITIADSSGTISIDDVCKGVYSNDNAAREFLNYVDAGVENITGRITRIGAYQNRITSAIEIAIPACSLLPLEISSSKSFAIPPVSINVKVLPLH